MTRPRQSLADIKAIKKLNRSAKYSGPVIALTMRYCGCTFDEIAKVFGTSRQATKALVKTQEEKL